jgi:FixJ family two-component response regulator
LERIPTISIIDDDISVRESLHSLIRSLGFAARTYESAEEFLESGDVHRTSCLIADLQMPGLSGADLQTILIDRGHDRPLIIVTAFPDDRVREQVLDAGAIAFLSKPFDADILIRHIETALRRHGWESGGGHHPA